MALRLRRGGKTYVFKSPSKSLVKRYSGTKGATVTSSSKLRSNKSAQMMLAISETIRQDALAKAKAKEIEDSRLRAVAQATSGDERVKEMATQPTGDLLKQYFPKFGIVQAVASYYPGIRSLVPGAKTLFLSRRKETTAEQQAINLAQAEQDAEYSKDIAAAETEEDLAQKNWWEIFNTQEEELQNLREDMIAKELAAEYEKEQLQTQLGLFQDYVDYSVNTQNAELEAMKQGLSREDIEAARESASDYLGSIPQSSESTGLFGDTSKTLTYVVVGGAIIGGIVLLSK